MSSVASPEHLQEGRAVLEWGRTMSGIPGWSAEAAEMRRKFLLWPK